MASEHVEFELWQTGNVVKSCSESCRFDVEGTALLRVSLFAMCRGSVFRFDCLDACVWGRRTKVTSLPSCEEAETCSKNDLKESLDNLSFMELFSA